MSSGPRAFWNESANDWPSLPMFFTVRLTMQNCPAAFTLTRLSPTDSCPQLNDFTTNSNLPSRTGVSIRAEVRAGRVVVGTAVGGGGVAFT